MKAVISSFGSSGDFNPCLGLGRALRKKGVEVIFLSNPYYEKKITEAGLTFIPAGEYWDVFKEIQDNPGFLHPQKGPLMVWDLVLETVPVMYPAMTDLIARQKPDVVACHILEFGGILAAIQNHIPYATLSPTPMGWFGISQPGHLNYSSMPLWIRRTQARIIRFLMNIAYRYQMQRYCQKRQIPNPVKQIEDMYKRASVNLGFWSERLRPKASDDPPTSQICGFVRDEHIKDWPDVPESIQKLFSLDRRPVVVGLGSTASLHGADIFRRAAQACRSLDWPCLLIGKNTEPFADPDKNIAAVDFAPYGWVFPRAGLVIHHGGVNTTAETLRSGVPGLVIPHAYDQFDNAIRTQQMGLARRLRTRQVKSPVFFSTIQTILNDARMHDCASAFSRQLQAEPDGADIAADAMIQAIGNTA